MPAPALVQLAPRLSEESEERAESLSWLSEESVEGGDEKGVRKARVREDRIVQQGLLSVSHQEERLLGT